MKKQCPACGQPLPKRLLGAEALLDILRAGGEKIWVHKGQNSRRWYITHGLGEADPQAVQELVSTGAISPVYSNCPGDAFNVGPTLDVEATLASREGRPKSEWQTIYVALPAPPDPHR